MDFTFKTIHQFNDYFKDEATCYQFLEQQWWNGTPVCPHCGSAKKPYNVKPRGKFTDIPSYRCSDRDCDLPFTVRTKSIFEGSKVELRKWLQASYELSTAKKGISSVELGVRIGVSQKTAWFINHRLRAMLTDTNPALLTGEVEIDETYVGGKNKNRHNDKKLDGRGTSNKTIILGILERDGNVKTHMVASNDSDTLQPIINEATGVGALLITDTHGGYNGIALTPDKEYKHETVNHSGGEYVRDGVIHTNSIEGFWSLLKRGIIGTFHQVSPQHLHRYCDEFSFRYNQRDKTNISTLNDTLSRVHNTRLTYAVLTSTPRRTKKTEAMKPIN